MKPCFDNGLYWTLAATQAATWGESGVWTVATTMSSTPPCLMAENCLVFSSSPNWNDQHGRRCHYNVIPIELSRLVLYGGADRHSENVLNMERSSKEAVPDWSSICSMSDSSCCWPGWPVAAPVWLLTVAPLPSAAWLPPCHWPHIPEPDGVDVAGWA